MVACILKVVFSYVMNTHYASNRALYLLDIISKQLIFSVDFFVETTGYIQMHCISEH